jgi:hypothetical protein
MIGQTADLPIGVSGATLGALRPQVVAARNDCERLRKGIVTVQQYLGVLEVARAEATGQARGWLQGQIAHLNTLLIVRRNQLSDANRRLQEMLCHPAR